MLFTALRVDAPCGGVLLIGDVIQPVGGGAFVVDFEHRNMSHESVGGSSVPVFFPGLKEDSITWPDHLDCAASSLG
jgi:hypothetical protein